MSPPSGWEAYIMVRLITEGETLKRCVFCFLFFFTAEANSKIGRNFFGGRGDLKEAKPFRRWCNHLTLPPHKPLSGVLLADSPPYANAPLAPGGPAVT